MSESGGIPRMCSFMDSHMVLAIMVWMKKSGQKVVGLDEVMKDMKLAWPYLALDMEVETETSAKADKQQEICQRLEASVSSLVKCLLSIKTDMMSGEGRTIWERQTIAELSSVWARRDRSDEEDDEDGSVEGFTVGTLQDILAYTRVFYESADYKGVYLRSRFYLECVSELVTEASNDDATREEFLWGSLLALCMLLRTNGQTEDLGSIDFDVIPQLGLQIESLIDVPVDNSQAAFNKKDLLPLVWLIHSLIWPLFLHYLKTSRVSSRHSGPWMDLIDWLLSERVVQCVQAVAPHLIRYYAALAILLRKREETVQAIGTLISNTAHKYEDPLTRLVDSVFLECDFDKSQQELKEVVILCRNDYLLADLASTIEDQARLLVFDNYCRIHRSINIR